MMSSVVAFVYVLLLIGLAFAVAAILAWTACCGVAGIFKGVHVSWLKVIGRFWTRV